MGPLAILLFPPALAQDHADDAWLDGIGGVDVPEDAAPIINGAPAAESEWPMTGGLVVGGTAAVAGFDPVSGRMLMCSSTLIAPDVVLIAAHCIDVDGLIDAAAVQGYQIESLTELELAWSRESDLSRYQLDASLTGALPEWPDDAAFATEWPSHEGFNLFTLQVGLAENDDIGLMFLDRAVTDVPFAILTTAEEAAQIEEGADVVIVGWGQQQQDALPGTVGTKQVADSYISALADYELKVGEVYDDGRKCHGDSGGPTFLEIDTPSAEKWRLIGVTSHAWDASTDCRVTGGVDTRVDYHLDWIDEQMQAACADGTRVWCEEPGIIAPPDEDGLFPWELDAIADAGEEEPKGCGCDASPGLAVGWAPLLVLLGLRRRG